MRPQLPGAATMADRTLSAGESLAARLAALDPERRRLLRERLAPGGAARGPVPIPRDGRPLPASFLQERLWLAEQLDPGSAAYVTALAVRIVGDLDPALLRRALALVVDRHEVLRTGLVRHGERVVQAVARSVPERFEEFDLRETAEVWPAADRILAEAAGTGFDLADPPLLRARLIRIATRDHVLGLFAHHVVTDGWSNGILLREIGDAYRALGAGPDPQPAALPVQYADAAAWQRERLTAEREAELLRFWTERLAGLPAATRLPADRPHRPERSRRAASHLFTVPAPTANALAALARELGSTPFAVALAATAAGLARWSGETDLAIGNSRADRPHPDLEALIGPFLNTVVLRMDVSGEPSPRQLAEQAHRVALEAQLHADLPFDLLVERLRPPREPGRGPLFQVSLGAGNFPRSALALPGTLVAPVPIAREAVAKFELALYVETAESWSWRIEYDTGLFDPQTVADLADHLAAFLDRAAAEPDRPGLPVAVPAQGAGTPRGTGQRAGGGFVEPRDRWEWDLAHIWSEVLDVDPVGATDDFFDLGGHSMAAMLIIDRIRSASGVAVTLDTVLRCRTVEALAAAVRAGGSVEPPFLVPLRAGGQGAPLLLAHPAVGEMGMYYHLVRALPEGRPVYGVKSDGFFREPAPAQLTLEQMAQHYAEEILGLLPDGPYHLAGFSAAGRVALAVADRLHALGARLGAVVLLDTAPFGDVAPDPDLAEILARWLPFSPPAEELRGLGEHELADRVLAAGRRSRLLPPDLGEDGFRQLCRRLEFNGRALVGYRRPAYPGTVTLFTTPRTPERDLAEAWHGLPIGGLRVRRIDTGSHLGFSVGPAVPEVARILAECLDEAEAVPTGVPR